MMNKQEYLLVCLGEECAEVAQEVSKCLRFSLQDKHPNLHRSNVERLRVELAGIVSAMRQLSEIGVDLSVSEKDIKEASDKRLLFMEYSQKIGTLTRS